MIKIRIVIKAIQVAKDLFSNYGFNLTHYLERLMKKLLFLIIIAASSTLFSACHDNKSVETKSETVEKQTESKGGLFPQGGGEAPVEVHSRAEQQANMLGAHYGVKEEEKK